MTLWPSMTKSERIAALQALLAEHSGRTGEDMANALGAKSRMAVISFINRNAEHFPTWSSARAGGTATAANLRRHRAKDVSLASGPVPTEVGPSPVSRYAGAFQPLPGVTPVLLADLPPGGCKWPVSMEDSRLMCGCPSKTGRYCPTHEQRSGLRLPAVA